MMLWLLEQGMLDVKQRWLVSPSNIKSRALWGACRDNRTICIDNESFLLAEVLLIVTSFAQVFEIIKREQH